MDGKRTHMRPPRLGLTLFRVGGWESVVDTSRIDEQKVPRNLFQFVRASKVLIDFMNKFKRTGRIQLILENRIFEGLEKVENLKSDSTLDFEYKESWGI